MFHPVSVKNRFQISSDYTKTDRKSGETGNTASLSGNAKIDDKPDVHTTFAVTNASKDGKTRSIVFGSKRKLNDEVDTPAQARGT
ncbi:MAG: hypothetical protein DRP85_06400 [Candidatus Makaraimicrobium thalassicum]|nr:MAG: hypothetical protein DRP85_06400 [Candidatus Omnitrophota bacterium]